MRVAEGDFAHKIEVASRDEIGVLTDTFNDMAGQLQDTIRQVENERNKLNTLFLHMTDGVVAFSRTGEVIHFNPSAEEMLHRPIGTDTPSGSCSAAWSLWSGCWRCPTTSRKSRRLRSDSSSC